MTKASEPNINDLEPALMLDKMFNEMNQRLEEHTVERIYDPQSDDDMLDFAEFELGVKIRPVPVIKQIFLTIVEDARKKRIIRDAILGPRGGGKTRLAATIALVLYRFFGYDIQNIGGSMKQAQVCYGYVREAHDQSKMMASFLLKEQTMTETRSKDGNKIQVCGASDTSIRGPHPGGENQGGLLIIDEVAVVKDQHVDAAKGQLTSANPSACIQLSTMGEVQTGRWHELIEDPTHHGYRFHQFDIFDVAKTCPYDCATSCPEKGFAKDIYQDIEGEDPPLIHKAYCNGRAHNSDGWITVDEIKMQYDELPRESFEREHLGFNTSMVGKVFDPLLMNACSVESINLGKDADAHRANLKKMEKAVGHDWGWSGMAASCYVVRWRRALIVYRWEMWDHVQFEKIGRHIIDTAYEEQIEAILADAAEPSANDAMRESSDVKGERVYHRTGEEFYAQVGSVPFGVWKKYGYGEIRRRMERVDHNRPLLLFPKLFGGAPVPGYDKAMSMLRAHKRKDDGMPAKIDDHPSDALMCAVLPFSRRWRTEPAIA